ncbi:MAG: hypothetical protein R3275_13225 [Saprospiraceae bacterium]|nr:hypothetical protein [Saprospiraceae bacterium]
MKLARINKILEGYLSAIETGQFPTVRLSLAIDRFKEHWSFEKGDFRSVFERAVDNEIFKVFNPDRTITPKDVMIKMIEKNPVAIRQMFLDLLYERVDLESRVEHFMLECDANFKPLTQEVGNPFRNHFHDHIDQISVYLTLRYPKKYGLMNYESLSSFLRFVQARVLPERNEYARLFNLMSVLGKIIMRDDKLCDLLEQKHSILLEYPEIMATDVLIYFANEYDQMGDLADP